MNDECADKIADNRFAIENSRDWLVNDGGIVDRMHRMSAKTVSFFLFRRINYRQHLVSDYNFCFLHLPKAKNSLRLGLD
jgi:hypothetical protein